MPSARDKQQAAEQSLHNQVNLLPRARLLIVFSTISLTLLISFIDQNGISVTLPTIAKALNAEATISWAGTSSLIANTTFQMLYGRLSDIFGRKVVFLAATAALSVACLLCGLSHSAPAFYVFRGIAGIGGGGLANLAMIIVSDIVTLEQRGKYQGIIGACVGVGNVIGPFLAAAFIARATWRAFFWTISPLAAVVGVISFLLLPSTPPTEQFRESITKIDYAGVLLSSIGVIFILIPVSGGGAYFRWDSPMVIAMLAIGAVSLILFVFWEWKFAKLPMMPVQFFANPVLCVMLTQSFLLGAVYQSSLYYLPLYLQNARQFTVLQSAAVVAVMVVSQAILSICSGVYMSHFKRWKEVVCSGFALWTLGAGLMLRLNRASSTGEIVGSVLVMGIGTGQTFQPTLVALQSYVTTSRRAAIISVRNFFRCGGGAVGLALSAAVQQAALRSSLPSEYRYLASSTYALPQVTGPDFDGVLDAYMAASHAVFILQVPLIGSCLLGCIFLKDLGLQPRTEESEKRGDEEIAGEGHGGKTKEDGVVGVADQEREKENGNRDGVALHPIQSID